MDEMNMKRTMECKIGMACQDLIYERMMEFCRIVNVEGIWKVKGKIKDGKRILNGKLEESKVCM